MHIGFSNSYQTDGAAALAFYDNVFSIYTESESGKKCSSGKRDSVEISSEAYRMQIESDDTNKKLTAADKEAQSKREAAFMKSVLDFNMAVAKQQSEARSDMYRDMSKGMKIAMKLLSGKKVSKEEMDFLMRTNPDLYDMIMALRVLSKNKEKREVSTEHEVETDEQERESSKGVSWSDFEWKSYEACLDIQPKMS